jgi:hypothetical protein
MAATPIGASLRYIPEGVRHFNFLPAIATLSAPTRAEINAGTDLTPQVSAFGNWGILASAVNTPDLASTFVPTIPGLITVDGSTIDMYADSTSNDVRTLLPRNTVGFILMLPEGDVPTRKMDVFPVKVMSIEKLASIGGNPATISINFSVTSLPQENVTVPA